MDDVTVQMLDVGSGENARRIAVRWRPGAPPGLVWLGGLRSDMDGTKAVALDDWAAAQRRACLRFDYSGHGRSSGRFEDGTISRWLEEAEAVYARFASGPQILVGSSMGGWIALLLARRLAQQGGGAAPPAGLVLIAPAPDFTERLIWAEFSQEARRAIVEDGVFMRPSIYGEGPYPITRALIEDGRRHLMLDAPIAVNVPVHILQGVQDPDVPWRHALCLVETLASDDVVLTLIEDGDHRLSRPEDIERIIAAVEGIAGEA